MEPSTSDKKKKLKKTFSFKTAESSEFSEVTESSKEETSEKKERKAKKIKNAITKHIKPSAIISKIKSRERSDEKNSTEETEEMNEDSTEDWPQLNSIQLREASNEGIPLPYDKEDSSEQSESQREGKNSRNFRVKRAESLKHKETHQLLPHDRKFKKQISSGNLNLDEIKRTESMESDMPNLMPRRQSTTAKAFQKRFPFLGPKERIIDTFLCALLLRGALLAQGCMYITENFICFYANIFGKKIRVTVNFLDIVCVRKRKMLKSIPNSIEIHSQHKKYFWASFIHRTVNLTFSILFFRF